jgi:hypothetical protein
LEAHLQVCNMREEDGSVNQVLERETTLLMRLKSAR